MRVRLALDPNSTSLDHAVTLLELFDDEVARVASVEMRKNGSAYDVRATARHANTYVTTEYVEVENTGDGAGQIIELSWRASTNAGSLRYPQNGTVCIRNGLREACEGLDQHVRYIGLSNYGDEVKHVMFGLRPGPGDPPSTPVNFYLDRFELRAP